MNSLGRRNFSEHALQRRAERAEVLRGQISGKELLNAISKDLGRVISEEELPVVKFKTETRLKLLGKILPDLKAVEHKVEEGDKTPALVALMNLSEEEIELGLRFAQKLNAGGETIDAELVEVDKGK